MANYNTQERLSLLSTDYVDFLQGDFVKKISLDLGKATNFDNGKVDILSYGIQLYLLFLLDFSGFVSYLSSQCNLSENQASILAGGLLAALPDDFIIKQDNMYQSFNTENVVQEDPSLATEVVVPAAKQPPKEVPVAKQSSHIRTMAQDMTRSQAPDDIVFTSTQAAILKEKSSVDKTGQ